MMRAWAAAALLGAVTVAGFAPLYLFPLPILTLALLFGLWRRCASPWQAAGIGYSFGLGLFLAGVSWVYISLHDFGAMPMPLAGVLTLLFCMVLACYPALAGFIYRRCGAATMWSVVLVLPAIWTLCEWLRGWLFTGFPWLALGYAQVPHGPLSGYVPLFGVYGASYLTLLLGVLLTILVSDSRQRAATADSHHVAQRVLTHPALAIMVCIVGGGYALKAVEWTHPHGAPVSVSLVQGNVAQEMKWRPDRIVSTLVAYRDLMLAGKARLMVLPETALPLFLHELPPGYMEGIAAQVRSRDADVLIGIPERTDARHYYNSVLSFGASPTQTYRKSHLVPFGEFIPLKPLFGWFFDVAQIPLLDFARGTDTPQPLSVAGQEVAINVCYEDAFGEEIIRQLPRATLLVNVSNVAWFGHSLAPMQHLQISQTRALETGRYMLRATNTGMTAIIDQRGRVADVAPTYTTAVVSGDVQGYAGATPYVRWGNMPLIVAMVALLLVGAWLARRENGKIRALPTP